MYDIPIDYIEHKLELNRKKCKRYRDKITYKTVATNVSKIIHCNSRIVGYLAQITKNKKRYQTRFKTKAEAISFVKSIKQGG